MTESVTKTTVLGSGVTHAHLVAVVEGWLSRALKEVAPEERVVWAVSFQVFPAPSEEESWVPTLVIYFEMAISEDDAFYATHLLPPFALTREQVVELTRDNIAALRGRRDQFLAGRATAGEVSPNR